MKITLIIPPSIFLVDERVFVSLGILRVAACLEAEHHEVDMLDLSGVENYEDVIKSYLATTISKVIGITATTPQMPAVEKIINVIREVAPDIKIILGGPHVTVTHAAFKLERRKNIVGRAHNAQRRIEKLVDVIVAGDGEKAIIEALGDGAPKIIDADEPKMGELFLKEDELANYPIPARHLVDISSYKYQIDGRNATSLIAQLGCPYGCAFCGGRLSPMLRRSRIRDINNILYELEHLYIDYGFTGFMFYDDELNVNPKFVEHLRLIGDLQNKLGTDFRFRGFLKSNLVTDEQVRVMHEVGFRQILIGFESGNERILTNIQKKATRVQNTRCMEIAHKYDMKVKALMSIGHAGESEETIVDTHDWLLEVKPADFDCTVISTYPGTPYYDEAVLSDKENNIWTYTAKNGDKLHSFEVDFIKEANYYKGLPGEYKSYVFTDYISPERLVQMRDWLESDVRAKLNIPFYVPAPAAKFEASMGMIPAHIIKQSRTI